MREPSSVSPFSDQRGQGGILSLLRVLQDQGTQTGSQSVCETSLYGAEPFSVCTDLIRGPQQNIVG